MFYAILLGIILVLAFMYFRENWRLKGAYYLYLENAKEYEALDQGMTELGDAYQTDMLQYEEMIENLTDRAEIDKIARHEQAMTINGLRQANDEYFQENVGLRKQLDITQVIISEHDLNCLPHIVLSTSQRVLDEIKTQ